MQTPEELQGEVTLVIVKLKCLAVTLYFHIGFPEKTLPGLRFCAVSLDIMLLPLCGKRLTLYFTRFVINDTC